jgi:hypothetical protein
LTAAVPEVKPGPRLETSESVVADCGAWAQALPNATNKQRLNAVRSVMLTEMGAETFIVIL